MGVSCSDDSEVVDVYENWLMHNEFHLMTLEDSVKKNPTEWKKIKAYSKNPSTSVGNYHEWIYMRPIITGYEKASETDSPLFNDSVRISYLGRLVPNAYEPEGHIFDGSVYGAYNLRTNATVKFKLSNLVDGLATALMHMHRFETWRVYVPWSLGYGGVAQGTIPAFSNLIFEVTLYDFAPEGHAMSDQFGLK